MPTLPTGIFQAATGTHLFEYSQQVAYFALEVVQTGIHPLDLPLDDGAVQGRGLRRPFYGVAQACEEQAGW